MHHRFRISLIAVSLMFSCLLLLCGKQAQCAAAAPPIKIGILTPMTGPFVVVGTSVIKGFELYLAENNGKLGGHEIQVIKEDDEGKPDVGLLKVKKLIQKDKVDLVMGPVASPVVFAIRDVIHSSKIPLIAGTATAEGITKPPVASPFIFRVEPTASQIYKPYGEWVIKKTPHRKFAIIATDFAPGRDGAEFFKKGFEGAGGKIVKELYPKVAENDYAPFLSLLQGSGADAVYAWTAGADSVRLITQYAEFGLKGRLPLYGVSGVSEEIVLSSAGDSAVGIVSVFPFFSGITLPESKQFVSAYKKKYRDALPGSPDGNGYVIGMVIDAALKAAKGNIADKTGFCKVLSNVKLDKTPRGPIRFDANGQVICNVYVGRVEKVGDHVENVFVDVIPDTRQ